MYETIDCRFVDIEYGICALRPGEYAADYMGAGVFLESQRRRDGHGAGVVQVVAVRGDGQEAAERGHSRGPGGVRVLDEGECGGDRGAGEPQGAREGRAWKAAGEVREEVIRIDKTHFKY